MNAPTGEWRTISAAVFFGLAITGWMLIFLHEFGKKRYINVHVLLIRSESNMCNGLNTLPDSDSCPAQKEEVWI